MYKSEVTIPCKHCGEKTTIKIKSIDKMQAEIDALTTENNGLKTTINFLRNQASSTENKNDEFIKNMFKGMNGQW